MDTATELDFNQPSTLEAAITALEADFPADADKLEAWLLAGGRLGERVAGEANRRVIAMNRQTDQPEHMQAVLSFQSEVGPIWEVAADRLNQRLLDHPGIDSLEAKYEVYLRGAREARRLFRNENVELGVKEGELSASWQQLAGGATVEIDGNTIPAAAVRAILQEPDRDLRERAWKAWMNRLLADQPAVEEIYDQMVAVRRQMAHNAGCPDPVDWYFRSMGRFDYSPDDCMRLHEAVEEVIVPATAHLLQIRKKRLQLDQIRPWDTQVSLGGWGGPRPFAEPGRIEALAGAAFAEVHPTFAEDWSRLQAGGRLDLEARANKAPGAYMADIPDEALPYIFANFNGTRRDLVTLLHEGGHAFHAFLGRSQSLLAYRWAPTEFSEVASMSMELLGLDAMEALAADPARAHLAPDPVDLRELKLELLSQALHLFPMVSRLDTFQHKVYRGEAEGREARAQLWRSLDQRFGAGVDWTDLSAERAVGWHTAPHPFTHPFYFVEYALAQLGALQIRRNAARDRTGAIHAFRQALALGGSRPLPELFQTSGGALRFDAASLRELVLPLADEVQALLKA